MNDKIKEAIIRLKNTGNSDAQVINFLTVMFKISNEEALTYLEEISTNKCCEKNSV